VRSGVGIEQGARSGGLLSQERGPHNAWLTKWRERQVVDGRALGATDTAHPSPATAGHGPTVRPDDLFDRGEQGARLIRGVTSGSRPYGSGAGVVPHPKYDIVAGGAGAGNTQPCG
jgi:hypothetical protein